ncbi:uncharacterized protein LOC115712331 [Cannabis sativa]|uniref:uncharacterized protein LOC115712331 n=1 Tax=Cannabis sativa TaxID=3483 RepID=UPI0029CA1FE4|nr:uncharacterized protein LOC115712331 [Cannabis sativa]
MDKGRHMNEKMGLNLLPFEGVTETIKVTCDMFNPLQITSGWEKYLAMEVDNSNLHRNLHNRSILIIDKYSKWEPFDAWIPYLAANLFNLYVCKEQVEYESETSIDLIALCCLDIAWKTRDKYFSIGHLKAKYWELHSITQSKCYDMEFQILNALGFTKSLGVVTPLSFASYFESLVGMQFHFHDYTDLFCQTIVQLQCEYWVAKMRPSLIAALAALVISTLFPRKVFNQFYKALQENQIITEDEFFSFYPEMLKAFQKRKIKNEHLRWSHSTETLLNFPIKWKVGVKCVGTFSIFENVTIVEEPKLEPKLESCSTKKNEYFKELDKKIEDMQNKSKIVDGPFVVIVSFTLALQGWFGAIIPGCSGGLALIASVLTIISGCLYWLTHITNEKWLEQKYTSELLRMNEHLISVVESDDSNNFESWYPRNTLESASVFKAKLSSKLKEDKKREKKTKKWGSHKIVVVLIIVHICASVVNIIGFYQSCSKH